MVSFLVGRWWRGTDAAVEHATGSDPSEQRDLEVHDAAAAAGSLALVEHALPQRAPERLGAGHRRVGVQIDGAVAAVRRREVQQLVDQPPGQTAPCGARDGRTPGAAGRSRPRGSARRDGAGWADGRVRGSRGRRWRRPCRPARRPRPAGCAGRTRHRRRSRSMMSRVPARHVPGTEVAVDGVEHDGPRAVEVVGGRRPDAVVQHLHIICIKRVPPRGGIRMTPVT